MCQPAHGQCPEAPAPNHAPSYAGLQPQSSLCVGRVEWAASPDEETRKTEDGVLFSVYGSLVSHPVPGRRILEVDDSLI